LSSEARAPRENTSAYEACITRLQDSKVWVLMDASVIRDGDACVFYLRTKAEFKFRNIIDEVVFSNFDSWVWAQGNGVRANPKRAADSIRQEAAEELDDARRAANPR
jgi:hypothetical protein